MSLTCNIQWLIHALCYTSPSLGNILLVHMEANLKAYSPNNEVYSKIKFNLRGTITIWFKWVISNYSDKQNKKYLGNFSVSKQASFWKEAGQLCVYGGEGFMSDKGKHIIYLFIYLTLKQFQFRDYQCVYLSCWISIKHYYLDLNMYVLFMYTNPQSSETLLCVPTHSHTHMHAKAHTHDYVLYVFTKVLI